MPTRNSDGRLEFGAIENIRVNLPGGVELHAQEATIEADSQTTNDAFSLGLVDHAELTGTIEVDRSRLDLIAELSGEVSETPQPGYQDFVKPRAALHTINPMDGLNSSAVAASAALRNALNRIREDTVKWRRIQSMPQTSLAHGFPWYGLDAIDALADASVSAGISRKQTEAFMEALNGAWERLSDDFEIGDESQYTETDPISFDELMGFGGKSE